jgi:hypothetical protein
LTAGTERGYGRLLPRHAVAGFGAAGIARRRPRISAVAVERFRVKNCSPGAPACSTSSAQPGHQVEADLPEALLVESAAAQQFRLDDVARQLREPDKDANRSIWLGTVTGMMPADHDRHGAAERPEALHQRDVGLRVEEQLRDGELGTRLLLVEQDPRVEVDVAVGMTRSGNAATPTLKSPMERTRRTRSVALPRPSGCGTNAPPPGGSPRRARIVRDAEPRCRTSMRAADLAAATVRRR